MNFHRPVWLTETGNGENKSRLNNLSRWQTGDGPVTDRWRTGDGPWRRGKCDLSMWYTYQIKPITYNQDNLKWPRTTPNDISTFSSSTIWSIWYGPYDMVHMTWSIWCGSYEMDHMIWIMPDVFMVKTNSIYSINFQLSSTQLDVKTTDISLVMSQLQF